MRRRDFRRLVTEALEGLAPAFRQRLENVAVVVQQWPTREQLRRNGMRDPYELLGLYEGIPLPERDSSYGMVLPDKITLFQGSLEAACDSEEELVQEVRKTVVHEMAHHFGISDEALEKLGY